MTGHNLIENLEIEVERNGDVEVYQVDVLVKWVYDPGVWTYKNGDPGYPSSFDYDFEIIHAHQLTDEGLEELGSEYYDELWSSVSDKLDEMDIDKLKG